MKKVCKIMFVFVVLFTMQAPMLGMLRNGQQLALRAAMAQARRPFGNQCAMMHCLTQVPEISKKEKIGEADEKQNTIIELRKKLSVLDDDIRESRKDAAIFLMSGPILVVGGRSAEASLYAMRGYMPESCHDIIESIGHLAVYGGHVIALLFTPYLIIWAFQSFGEINVLKGQRRNLEKEIASASH